MRMPIVAPAPAPMPSTPDIPPPFAAAGRPWVPCRLKCPLPLPFCGGETDHGADARSMGADADAIPIPDGLARASACAVAGVVMRHMRACAAALDAARAAPSPAAAAPLRTAPFCLPAKFFCRRIAAMCACTAGSAALRGSSVRTEGLRNEPLLACECCV